MMLNTSNIFVQEPFEQYASKQKEYMSSHRLFEYSKDPSVFKMQSDGIIPPRDSSAYAFGRAAHCLICEGPQEYAKRYVLGDCPVNPKTGKSFGRDSEKFKEYAAKFPDKILLTKEDAKALKAMADSVSEHPVAKDYFHVGVPEAVCRTNIELNGDNGPVTIDCQIRVDFWDEELNAIVDLKSTRSLDSFADDAKRYGYFYQMAFYQMVVGRKAGIRTIDGYYVRPSVVIVAVENELPYRTAVYKFRIDNNPLFAEQNKVKKDLYNWAQSNKNDYFVSPFNQGQYFYN